MITQSNADDIVYSSLFTGVHGNYLKPSIANAGMDPDNLPQSDPSAMDFSDKRNRPKSWKDIWGAGQGIGSVKELVSTQARVDQLYQEYVSARKNLWANPMGELYLIRHAQASFGAEDYDKLSALGHEQSIALGKALSQHGVMPEAWVMGDMRRHRETLEGIARGMGNSNLGPLIHNGLNEFDFTGLLNARYRGQAAPDNMHSDRKTHFRILRETVLAWQRDEIEDPPETWGALWAGLRPPANLLCRKVLRPSSP